MGKCYLIISGKTLGSDAFINEVFRTFHREKRKKQLSNAFQRVEMEITDHVMI